MANQMQRYNPQQEFAVERVYRKLTEGIDNLTAEEAVDGLLAGANHLRRGINEVIDRIFEGAEDKQSAVVQNRADQWTKATERVKDAIGEATASGDYDTVEKRLRDATKATIAAKESVSKMKFIKQRGQTDYNPTRELTAYVRELEDFVRRDYNGGPKLLEGEILP